MNCQFQVNPPKTIHVIREAYYRGCNCQVIPTRLLENSTHTDNVRPQLVHLTLPANIHVCLVTNEDYQTNTDITYPKIKSTIVLRYFYHAYMNSSSFHVDYHYYLDECQ